ncbi:hypothetical protein Tco_0561601 [Tanacetum coccineum]
MYVDLCRGFVRLANARALKHIPQSVLLLDKVKQRNMICVSRSDGEEDLGAQDEVKIIKVVTVSTTKGLSLSQAEYGAVIIIAQQQHTADVHPDKLCPPNKRYDLMDTNKKVDLDHVQPSAPRRSTVIPLRLPERRSTRLTPPAPVPTVDKADEIILQDTLQISLAEHKSREEHEARENVALVDKHLAPEEIEKLLDGQENIVDCSSIPKNDESNIPGTRIEPRSDKESPEVEIAKEKEVEISKEKEKIPTRFKSTEILHEYNGRYGYSVCTSTARFMPRKSFRIHLSDTLHDVLVEIFSCYGVKHSKEHGGEERGNIQAQISTQIENAIANVIPSQVDASVRSYMSGHILHVHPAQSQTSSVPEQQYQLYLAMKADPQLQQQDIAIWLALQMKFERNTVLQTTCRTHAVRTRDQDDPHDDAHPEGENSAKRQKTSEYEAYVSGESSSGQVFQEEQAPSTLGNQEQNDDFDFWTDSYASDDDEIPSKQVSQEIMEEVSLTIDEAKLRKMADEMLRQRCTSGDEHQYHIDQMKIFFKNDIEYSGTEKIVLLLHKFPAIIFNDDDIEERTSIWVNKVCKKLHPYADMVLILEESSCDISHKETRRALEKPNKEIYSNSKIIQVIKTAGHNEVLTKKESK